ncbi:MAG: hypothetical protein WC876_03375 [Candidatus Thermoplasmatota archaeon]
MLVDVIVEDVVVLLDDVEVADVDAVVLADVVIEDVDILLDDVEVVLVEAPVDV